MLAIFSYINDPVTALLEREMGKIISLALIKLPIHETVPPGTYKNIFPFILLFVFPNVINNLASNKIPYLLGK